VTYLQHGNANMKIDGKMNGSNGMRWGMRKINARYPARGRCASTNTLSWCGYSAGSVGPKLHSFEVVHEVVLDGDTCNLDRHCNHYSQ
jgi:hypothetical protein